MTGWGWSRPPACTKAKRHRWATTGLKVKTCQLCGAVTRGQLSRADRLEVALDGIREVMDKYRDTAEELRSIADEIESAIGEAEGVEFPTMYG